MSEEHHHDEHVHHHKKKKQTKVSWKAITSVLAVLLVISLITSGFRVWGTGLSQEEATDKALSFINENLLQGRAAAQLTSIDEKAGVYSLVLDIEGQSVETFVSKDGQLLFVQGAIDMDNFDAPDQPQQQPPAEVPKSDKPVAELFVMTHCPYGTQAAKGFLPMLEAIGNSADAKIRFVHYYMHTNNQEEVETPRQVCIREEQADKFVPYLTCFLGGTSGTPAEAKSCEEEVGVDSAKLAECISSEKSEEYYNEDKELSESYGVQGSPSLVVNGQQASSGRSSAEYLATVCNAFNEAPEECLEELSSASPSPGFGYSASGSATTASCG